jgi:mannonate dehydratase
VKQAGLVFEAIENVPTHFYNKVMLGLPGRDEQIENYRKTLRNIGKAGIPILGFHWMPNSVWRTERLAPARGGAGATKFDLAEIEGKSKKQLRKYLPTTLGREMPIYDEKDGVVTADQMFANYKYFIEAVLPVAEEANVRLALHPDDPPVPMLGGVARIFKEPEDFKKAWRLNPKSDYWGLDLCLGCCSEMPGGAANVREMIRFFGPKGRIFYVHFRDVKGTVPDFTECFIGEGNFNPAEIMALLKKSGFTGFLLDDHVPHMDDDTDWNHRGRSHAIGYMQGLLNAEARARA